MFLLQRKYRPLLGLDITTSSVKLIELAMSGGQYRVEAYAAEPTPQNAINEKAIVDAEAVGEAIRRAVKRAGAKASEVAVAISGDAAITKVIQMPDGGIDRTIAVVDFGASSTTFSVLRNLKVVYTRDFAFGGQQLTEEIMRTYGLSMEEAGRAKKEGGLPGNYQAEVLDPFTDDMTQQVSRSLQFYLASGSGREQPEKILVCGGCANIAGVADVIASRVGISAEKGDPLGQMKLSSRAKAQAVQRDATALLTACGLALRSFD